MPEEGGRSDRVAEEGRIIALIYKFMSSTGINAFTFASLLFLFVETVESVNSDASGSPGHAEGRDHYPVTKLISILLVLIPMRREIRVSV